MYIKFLNSNTAVECSVIPAGNVVTMKFKDDIVVNTSGFHCYLDKDCRYDISGNSYEGFTTLYRDDEETDKYNGYQLSDDGSVYVPPAEPEPTPEPEPYVPTLEEVQEEKVEEMNVAQQEVIQQGINVTLTDGTVEHFTLTDRDKTSLMGLQTQVALGTENIPWHTSDQTEHCKYYSNADMALITTAALQYVTFHETYFRDLRIYIRSLETKEEVEAVTYGIVIPEEFQSDPLKDMYAAMQEV